MDLAKGFIFIEILIAFLLFALFSVVILDQQSHIARYFHQDILQKKAFDFIEEAGERQQFGFAVAEAPAHFSLEIQENSFDSLIILRWEGSSSFMPIYLELRRLIVPFNV